jgi:hypothetical protein
MFGIKLLLFTRKDGVRKIKVMLKTSFTFLTREEAIYLRDELSRKIEELEAGDENRIA